jgi:hypothetical protein
MAGWGNKVVSWSGCIDHRLDLVTGVAFDHVGVADVTKKCRAIASFHNHSTQAAEKLSEQCRILGYDAKRIYQDVVTRWWSTFSMVESIVCMKRPLQNLMAVFSDECQLSSDDWGTIELLYNVLEPFMVAQKTLEAANVTGSLAIPLIKLIRNSLEASVASQSGRVQTTLEAMKLKFDQKFGDGTGFSTFSPNGWNAKTGYRKQPSGFTKVQVLATALDPRCKDLIGIPSNEHRDIHLLVMQAVHEEIQRKNKTTTSIPVKTTHLVAEEEDSDICFSSLRNLSQMSPPAQPSEQPTLTAEIQREFTLYNLEQVIHQNADPLAWWKTKKAMYPLLATLARRVLAVPATSANAERLFSKAGLTLTDKRNRLSGDNVELLVWLREAWQPLEDYEAKLKSNT